MTRKQDSARGRIRAEDLKKLLSEDRDLLKTIVEETLQQVLEAEMDEALQASKDLRKEHAAVDDAMGRQIESLRKLKIGELRTRYRDVFGEASPSFNRAHLFRRIAWKQRLDDGCEDPSTRSAT